MLWPAIVRACASHGRRAQVTDKDHADRRPIEHLNGYRANDGAAGKGIASFPAVHLSVEALELVDSLAMKKADARQVFEHTNHGQVLAERLNVRWKGKPAVAHQIIGRYAFLTHHPIDH